MKLISGAASEHLSKEVSDILNVSMVPVYNKSFADGELYMKIGENIRGSDVYIIQSTSPDVNDNIMHLLLMLDAIKRSSAKSINLIIPYSGYARQDRKVESRSPISARLVSSMIEFAGATRVMTIDLHSKQGEGFFSVAADNLFAMRFLYKEIANYVRKNYDKKDVLVVSPDTGGVPRARALGKLFNSSIAIVDKRRDVDGIAEVMNVVGDPKGKVCIIIDDMIDSGNTIIKAAEALKKEGAMAVIGAATHGLFTGNAFENIEKSSFKKFFITNTIALSDKIKRSEKIREISVAPMIAECIRRIERRESVSELFG